MPYGGNDWLALTPEPALEPELPICDPHHHFWDQRPERIPYQRYLLPELLADIQGHNLRSTVFVQARSMYRAEGPIEMRPIGEVEFVQGIAAASASGIYGATRVAAAIVGHANLNLGEAVEPVLEALQTASANRLRGIRHIVTWDKHPEIEATQGQEGQLASEQFRAGARAVARRGLSFDAMIYFPQLPELADFARSIPELPIILNHMGGLLRYGPYANRDDEVLEQWRKGLAALAECPNVSVKLGGIGQPRTGFDWHLRPTPIGSEELATSMAPFMNYCIEQFGPNRCMFESNFPVDKVSHSYNVLFNAYKRMTAGYSASERVAMFHDNAVRVYRITD